jgi:CHAT domain-containing protein
MPPAAASCPAASLERFPESSRKPLESFLQRLSDIDFDPVQRKAEAKTLVAELAALGPSVKDLFQLYQEIENWVCWRRREGLCLAKAYEDLTLALNPPLHIFAGVLLASAQANFNDDFAFVSLEVSRHNIDLSAADPATASFFDTDALRHDLDLRLRLVHRFYEHWCRRFEYRDCNPLTSDLSTGFAEVKLHLAFPEMGFPASQGNSDALEQIIQQCAAPEQAYYAVLAGRLLGPVYHGQGRLELACTTLKAAFELAITVGLESQIGHLLRLHGYALRKIGDWGHAEACLVEAVNFEKSSFPDSVYWMALSARELADLRIEMAGSKEFQDRASKLLPGALRAYRQGRGNFDAYLSTYAVFPVGRAARQQLFRSYADNAIQIAAVQGDLPAFFGEVEANGPREATQLVSEVLAAAQIAPETVFDFKRDLAEFVHRMSTVGQSFDEYQRTRDESYRFHRAYLTRRARVAGAIVRGLDSERVAADILESDLAGTVFLFCTPGRNAGGLAVANMGDKTLRYWPAFYRESQLTQVNGVFRAALAEAEQMWLCEERVQDALDELLDSYQRILGPTLDTIATQSTGRRLKVFPRLEFNGLPFQALKIGDKYLIDYDCTVTYAQTLSQFHQLHTLPPAARAKASAGAADTAADSSAIVLFDDRPDEGAPLYEGALHHAGAAYGDRALVLRNPPWADFKRAVEDRPGVDVVFACHGKADLEDPFQSRLLLGGEQQICLKQILSDLPVGHVRCVIMGACESAVARAEVAAEYIGLPIVFHAAGVRYVIGSLWKVNQLATAVLLSTYFRLLGPGCDSIPAAWNAAQRALKSMTREEVGMWLDRNLPGDAEGMRQRLQSRGEKPFAHPYFWAGFCVYGDI